MSSFSKAGKRDEVRVTKREVKKRMRRVYEIMDELDVVAKEMYDSSIEYTEDNIAELAANYTNLNMDGLEKFLLLGKLMTLKDAETKDNI